MKEFLESTVGKTSSRLYDLIAIFYLFGALTGYQIIIANLIQGIMENLEVPGAQNYRLFHILLVSAFIVFPLCLFRSVDAFRYISLISILGIFYTALLLIIELPFFYMNPELQGKLELFKLNWGFFNAFGITFFAFTCQPGFFAAIEKLKKKDYEHKSKIVFRSVTINLSFYIIIILAGYLSTFDKTTDLIIHRKSPFKLDILMIVAQGMIVAGLCIGTPINFVPLRKAVWGQIFKDSEYTVGRYLF
jgi:amino acid permease